MSMTSAKTPAEKDRAARMFSIEQAVKMTRREGDNPVQTARDFYAFLAEGPDLSTNPVGFQPNDN